MTCAQRGTPLVREALAREGKLEATLQACAEDAQRRGASFFVLPQGIALHACPCKQAPSLFVLPLSSLISFL